MRKVKSLSPETLAALKRLAQASRPPRTEYDPLDGDMTLTELRQRGWTTTLVKRFFPIPTEQKENPRFEDGPPMKLYSLRSVVEMEARPDFKAAMAVAAIHRELALKGVAKRRARANAIISAFTPNLPDRDAATLYQEACSDYNSSKIVGQPGRVGAGMDRKRLDRIAVNYLRDSAERQVTFKTVRGLISRWDAGLEVSLKVLEAIAAKFPFLQPECSFQMEVEKMVTSICRKEGRCAGIGGLLWRSV